MEHWPPPCYEQMRIVFEHLYEACQRNSIPIDVTPGIEVSLIVQPGDTRYLAPHDWRSMWYGLEMKMLKLMAQPYFWWRMRPKEIGLSEVLAPPQRS